MRTAVTNAGGLDVELVEPGKEPSPYREFLDRHGEGLHHVMLGPAAEGGGAWEALERAGLPVLMQGRVGASAECAYFDASAQLKVTLEAMRGKASATSTWQPPAGS